MDITLFPLYPVRGGHQARHAYRLQVPDGMTVDDLAARVSAFRVERWDPDTGRVQEMYAHPLREGSLYLMHARSPEVMERAVRSLGAVMRTVASGRKPEEVLWVRMLQEKEGVCYEVYSSLDRPPVFRGRCPDEEPSEEVGKAILRRYRQQKEIIPTRETMSFQPWIDKGIYYAYGIWDF